MSTAVAACWQSSCNKVATTGLDFKRQQSISLPVTEKYSDMDKNIHKIKAPSVHKGGPLLSCHSSSKKGELFYYLLWLILNLLNAILSACHYYCSSILNIVISISDYFSVSCSLPGFHLLLLNVHLIVLLSVHCWWTEHSMTGFLSLPPFGATRVVCYDTSAQNPCTSI